LKNEEILCHRPRRLLKRKIKRYISLLYKCIDQILVLKFTSETSPCPKENVAI